MKMQRKYLGFTLLELLATMSMVVILLSVAVPSMRNFINRNGVLADQRALLTDISSGRAKAIESNSFVSICGRGASDYTCNGSDNWSNGWIVFVDDGSGSGATASNGLIEGDEQIVRIKQYDGNNSFEVLAGINVTSFGFDQRGYMNSALTDEQLTILICDPSGNVKFSRAVFVELTGRGKASVDLNSDGVHEDLAGVDLSC